MKQKSYHREIVARNVRGLFRKELEEAEEFHKAVPEILAINEDKINKKV